MSLELFHLALPQDWQAAQALGEYRTSTRGMTLDQVGFIHCSTNEQWPRVRARFYADVPGPLILLHIDPSGLDIRFEPGDPGSAELFPHLYGPLPVANVTDTRTVAAPHTAAGPGT